MLAGALALSNLLTLANSPDADFLAAGLPADAPGSVALCDVQGRRLLRYEAPPGAEVVALRAVRADEDKVCREPGAPERAYLELGPGEGALVELSDGRRILLFAEPGQVGLYEDQARLEVASLADIPSPPASWFAECGDHWLGERARAHLGLAHAWHNALAVALLARLVEPPRAQRAAIVQALREGRDVGPWAPARRWVLTLSKPQLDSLERRAVARVDSLLFLLQELQEQPEAASDEWRERLRRALLARDDLESVSVLLSEAGHAGRVRTLLEVVDGVGNQLLAGLPVKLTFDDEQLRRAARLQGSDWWARLAT